MAPHRHGRPAFFLLPASAETVKSAAWNVPTRLDARVQPVDGGAALYFEGDAGEVGSCLGVNFPLTHDAAAWPFNSFYFIIFFSRLRRGHEKKVNGHTPCNSPARVF